MRRDVIVLAVAMATAVLAIPTLASAHGAVPFSTPNVIHGCRGALGILRQVTSGACVGAETIVHWNITGPAGTNGTNGTNGSNGSNGTSVTLGVPFAGNANGCLNGGVPLMDGANTYYLCNGTDATGTGADGPCWDNTYANRYFDCGNGTVTDQKTGLIWLQDAACVTLGNPGGVAWLTAKGNVMTLEDGGCGLTDGSQRGDWRLPTFDEWAEAMDRVNVAGVCTDPDYPPEPFWLNDAGTGCYLDGLGSSFAGVALTFYWSSSTFEANTGNAWYAHLSIGNVFNNASKISTLRVWPVRGGPR